MVAFRDGYYKKILWSSRWRKKLCLVCSPLPSSGEGCSHPIFLRKGSTGWGSASPLALCRARGGPEPPTPPPGAGAPASLKEPLCRCHFAWLGSLCLSAWTFPSLVLPRQTALSRSFWELRTHQAFPAALQQWDLFCLCYQETWTPPAPGPDLPHFVPTKKLPNATMCICTHTSHGCI